MAEIRPRKRLDQLMVERGLARSRSAARDLIKRGEVQVAGLTRAKPSSAVDESDRIDVAREVADRVSRGGDKLTAALEAFGIAVAGRVCLDLGASSGGFTQELLARGAAHVSAVDVGHGQLDREIARDSRVTVLEGVDARDLDRGIIAEPVDLITADLSFISLSLALPRALGLAHPGAQLLALVKPQFELEPEAIGKGGVVRDPGAHERALAKVRGFVEAQAGWRILGETASPITGSGGNREFFLAAQLDR